MPIGSIGGQLSLTDLWNLLSHKEASSTQGSSSNDSASQSQSSSADFTILLSMAAQLATASGQSNASGSASSNSGNADNSQTPPPIAALQAASKALNINAGTLVGDLQSGQSLQDIATSQGVNYSDVQSAISDAVKPQLDQAVTNGVMSSSQEQTLLSNLTSGQFFPKNDAPAGASGNVEFGTAGQYMPPASWFGSTSTTQASNNQSQSSSRQPLPVVAINAAATALNLDPNSLVSDLQNGQSLQDVAKAQNVDFTAVQSAISGAVKPQLDQSVQSGQLNSTQEQTILQQLTSGNFLPPQNEPSNATDSSSTTGATNSSETALQSALTQFLEALTSRLQSDSATSTNSADGRGHGGHQQPLPMVALNAAATALNLDPATLVGDLQSGQSLQDIAKSQNIDFSTVQSAISAAVKPQLDQAVQAGGLSSDQETSLIDRMSSGDFFARPDGSVDSSGAGATQSASEATGTEQSGNSSVTDSLDAILATFLQELESAISSSATNTASGSSETTSSASATSSSSNTTSTNSLEKVLAELIQRLESDGTSSAESSSSVAPANSTDQSSQQQTGPTAPTTTTDATSQTSGDSEQAFWQAEAAQIGQLWAAMRGDATVSTSSVAHSAAANSDVSL